jgi:hypothetical protein
MARKSKSIEFFSTILWTSTQISTTQFKESKEQQGKAISHQRE